LTDDDSWLLTELSKSFSLPEPFLLVVAAIAGVAQSVSILDRKLVLQAEDELLAFRMALASR
jgi:hypothetical protein